MLWFERKEPTISCQNALHKHTAVGALEVKTTDFTYWQETPGTLALAWC